MVVVGGGVGGEIPWVRRDPGDNVPSGSLVVYSKKRAVVQYLIERGSAGIQ